MLIVQNKYRAMRQAIIIELSARAYGLTFQDLFDGSAIRQRDDAGYLAKTTAILLLRNRLGLTFREISLGLNISCACLVARRLIDRHDLKSDKNFSEKMRWVEQRFAEVNYLLNATVVKAIYGGPVAVEKEIDESLAEYAPLAEKIMFKNSLPLSYRLQL